MRSVSKKRQEWLDEYARVRDSFVPTECARCGLKGSDWTHKGGDFEPHHPYQRRTRAACLALSHSVADVIIGRMTTRQKHDSRDGL